MKQKHGEKGAAHFLFGFWYSVTLRGEQGECRDEENQHSFNEDNTGQHGKSTFKTIAKPASGNHDHVDSS